jgi:hypothetical protein
MYYYLSDGSGRARTYDLSLNGRMHQPVVLQNLETPFCSTSCIRHYLPLREGGQVPPFQQRDSNPCFGVENPML